MFGNSLPGQAAVQVHPHPAAGSDVGWQVITVGFGFAVELLRAVGDFSEAEIARARAQTRAGLVMGLESASARAERLASHLSIWGRAIPLEETVAKIDAVEVSDARAAAQAFAASVPAIALYGPVAGARPAADVAARLAA